MQSASKTVSTSDAAILTTRDHLVNRHRGGFYQDEASPSGQLAFASDITPDASVLLLELDADEGGVLEAYFTR